jgi:histidyl-tRNA synthetase
MVHQGDDGRIRAFIAAERLRDAGFDVILHCSADGAPSSFKSQMKRADASGAAYAVIIGDDEVANNVASVKGLRQSTGNGAGTAPHADVAPNAQEHVPFDALAEYLIDRIAGA